MRISKLSWLILGVGIFVIAAVGLYVVYSQQAAREEQLSDSLAVAQATSGRFTSDREALENELAQLESELDEAESLLSQSKASFRGSVESIEYDGLFFEFVNDLDLNIMSVTATEPFDEEGEGDIIFSVTSFVVEVWGKAEDCNTVGGYRIYVDDTVDDILDFVLAIANSEDFVVATIKTVDIMVPEFTDEQVEDMIERNIIREAVKPSVVIEIDIYSYKGE